MMIKYDNLESHHPDFEASAWIPRIESIVSIILRLYERIVRRCDVTSAMPSSRNIDGLDPLIGLVRIGTCRAGFFLWLEPTWVQFE